MRSCRPSDQNVCDYEANSMKKDDISMKAERREHNQKGPTRTYASLKYKQIEGGRRKGRRNEPGRNEDTKEQGKDDEGMNERPKRKDKVRKGRQKDARTGGGVNGFK